jgi:LacI family transcriptional regulator
VATIKQIADKAGVSIGTVDRVIHSRGRVSPETETRVRNVIRELGYRPNIFARHLKLASSFVFGVLMPRLDQDCNYWIMPARGMKRAGHELTSHRVTIRFFHYDRYSPSSFNRACDRVLSARIDGVLIAPVLSGPARAFLKRIPPQLPYIFFDSVIPGSSCLSCIIQDSYLSGKLSARLMELLIREAGTVATIRVLPGDNHIDDRIRGFQDYWKNGGSVTLKIYDARRRKDRTGFDTLMDRVVKENPDLRGIFVTNALTFPVARYLERHPSSGPVHVVGYDLIEDNIHYLKKGMIDFLISQRSELQGYQGIYTLFRHVVLKEPVPGKVMIPLDIITRENIDDYLNQGNAA